MDLGIKHISKKQSITIARVKMYSGIAPGLFEIDEYNRKIMALTSWSVFHTFGICPLLVKLRCSSAFFCNDLLSDSFPTWKSTCK